MSKRSISNDERVRQFADTADRFCRLIDTHSRFTKREFIHRCAEVLPELQMRFIQLLNVKTSWAACGGASNRKPISHSRWQSLSRKLARKIGKDDGYHLVFNPYKVGKDDPVFTFLNDDLSDIYGDLKEGLYLLRLGGGKTYHDAVHLWKFLFMHHTGHHCVCALRPLQVLIERYHEDD